MIILNQKIILLSCTLKRKFNICMFFLFMEIQTHPNMKRVREKVHRVMVVETDGCLVQIWII